MKRLLAALLLIATTASCVSRTEYGECIGVFDEGDSKLRYKPSGWNIAMGIIFIETIFVPIIVIFDQTKCPVGTKEASK